MNYSNQYAAPQAMYAHQVPHPATDYGTYEEITPLDPLSKAQSYGYFRRRLNVVAIILGYIVPWTLFCVVLSMTSMKMRYFYPLTTSLLTSVILLGLVLFAVHTAMMVMRRRSGLSKEDPHWRVFLVVTCFLAWFVAVWAGGQIYYRHTAPYWDLAGLRTRIEVDPAVNKGIEMMDAGIIDFYGDSGIDFNFAHGFKNGHTYCVAPITRNNATLGNYDFWAVGVDCCSGSGAAGDFQGCVAPGDQGGSQAVRYMFESTDRDFLRLAIQQAEAKYQIRATHPLFLLWAKDAEAFRDEYQRKGYRTYMQSTLAAFGVQVILVAAATSFIQNAC